jgi:DNA processing protein
MTGTQAPPTTDPLSAVAMPCESAERATAAGFERPPSAARLPLPAEQPPPSGADPQPSAEQPPLAAAPQPSSLSPAASARLPAEAYGAAIAGLPGMGPARLSAILAVTSPADAWSQVAAGRSWSDAEVVRALGARGAEVVQRWADSARDFDVAAAWESLVASDVEVTLYGRPGYPEAVAGDVEPPAVLFHRGDPGVITGPRVAVVGTRQCSSVGIAVAFELGRDLAAAGVVVVSGLAAGIDGAAHRGVMAARSAPPVGVVGSGLDVVYPRGQTALWRAVGRTGVLLSEAPLGARPERWRFPARNRIIAACADLVVVVESHRRGGSLHTVDEADRRGIDVMAVPGSVRNPAAAGTNDLLAEGRAPVCSVDDVLVALGLGAGGRDPAADRRPPPEPADRAVLDAVGWQPATLDQLVLRTEVGLATLAPALDRLCQAGWLARHGGWYERVGGPDAV